MAFKVPRVYPITDRSISGLSHASQVALLALGGATLIQLRDKHATPQEFFREAAEALVVARRLGVQLIINDRVDIALALAADGVHLGQNDLPPEAARRLLGPQAIIGLSCHNLDQIKAAAELSLEYLALGPFFHTTSKPDTEPLLSLSDLAAARAVVNGPLVAIGGISLANAAAIFEAGADSVAVISALLAQGQNISERLQQFLAL
jgi:thiamine-phosphate pyrophosphorylase